MMLDAFFVGGGVVVPSRKSILMECFLLLAMGCTEPLGNLKKPLKWCSKCGRFYLFWKAVICQIGDSHESFHVFPIFLFL